MAVLERSSLAGAFKRVLIHDILRWKVGGSNPSVPIGFLILYFLLFESACREMGAFLLVYLGV